MVVPGYLLLTDCGAHSSRDCGVVGLSGTKRAAFADISKFPWACTATFRKGPNELQSCTETSDNIH